MKVAAPVAMAWPQLGSAIVKRAAVTVEQKTTIRLRELSPGVQRLMM
jgi:hypothetical protein